MIDLSLVFTATLLAVASCGAPGDEDPFCRGFNPPEFPPNYRPLLDSYSYINLLPPHVNHVWQEINNDDNNNIEEGMTKVLLRICIMLYSAWLYL